MSPVELRVAQLSNGKIRVSDGKESHDLTPAQYQQLQAALQMHSQPAGDVAEFSNTPPKQEKSGFGFLGVLTAGVAAFFAWKYRANIKNLLGLAGKESKNAETALALRPNGVLRPKAEVAPTIAEAVATLGLSKDVPLTKAALRAAIKAHQKDGKIPLNILDAYKSLVGNIQATKPASGVKLLT